MKKNRVLKITLYAIGILLFLIICVLAFGYFYIQNKSPINKEKFPHHIGYIDQERALLNDVYELCNDGAIYKVHHGAPDDAFEVSKKSFRETLLVDYKNEGYSDSGYLNFRFLINCEGNAGWFEIVEMNLDLEEIDLNNNMVDQLFKLTSDSKHWKIYKYKDVPRNYYMYISYRIEHGEIVEILP